jgi:hypothetical protein
VSAQSYNFVTITIQCPIDEKLLITRGIAANAVSFYLGTLWYFYVTKNLHCKGDISPALTLNLTETGFGRGGCG